MSDTKRTLEQAEIQKLLAQQAEVSNKELVTRLEEAFGSDAAIYAQMSSGIDSVLRDSMIAIRLVQAMGVLADQRPSEITLKLIDAFRIHLDVHYDSIKTMMRKIDEQRELNKKRAKEAREAN